MQRPLGVTILAVLNIVGGVLGLLASLFMLGLFGLGGSAVGAETVGAVNGAALVTLVISILQIIVGVGLWRLLGWARFATVVVTFMNFGNAFWRTWGGVQTGNVTEIIGGLTGVIISLIIAYYLYRPDVRGAFR
jgi:uncharacterized membrane protein (DUF2068 family)